MTECKNCFYCSRVQGRLKCEKSGKMVKVWQPGCVNYADRVAEARRLLKEIEENRKKMTKEDIRRMDIYLTMSLNIVQAGKVFMDRIDYKLMMMGKDPGWARERKMALSKIRKHIADISKIYDTLFQSELERSMSFENRGTENQRTRTAEEFDMIFNDNSEDAFEMCRLVMRYTDKCLRNGENYEKAEEFLKSLPGRGIFSEEEYDKFYMKDE